MKKVFAITVKGFEPVTTCVKDQDAATVLKTHVKDKIFQLKPNSRFSDLSDSLNSMSSCSIKGKL